MTIASHALGHLGDGPIGESQDPSSSSSSLTQLPVTTVPISPTPSQNTIEDTGGDSGREHEALLEEFHRQHPPLTTVPPSRRSPVRMPAVAVEMMHRGLFDVDHPLADYSPVWPPNDDGSSEWAPNPSSLMSASNWRPTMGGLRLPTADPNDVDSSTGGSERFSLGTVQRDGKDDHVLKKPRNK